MNPEHLTIERSISHDLALAATAAGSANDPTAGGTTDPRWQSVFVHFCAVTVIVAGPVDRLNAVGVLLDTKEGPAKLHEERRHQPQQTSIKLMSNDKRSNRTNGIKVFSIKLSKADQFHFDGFNRKLDLIRDRTMTVGQGFQNGAYLVGPPGVSKTYTVEETLRNMKVAYVILNSKITAPGLWNHLREHPDHVTVVDDVPSVVAERPAQQLLLAALGGQPGEPRQIKHTTAEVNGRKDFEFRGSIIGISNVPLRRDPMADAVASRVPLLEHQPTDDEVAAFMRYLAGKGHNSLTPTEALEVAEFVIAESRASDYRLDLRHFVKGLGDRLFWEKNPDRTHWMDLVRTSMKKTVTGGPAKPLSQEERLADERNIVRELFEKHPGRGDKEARDKAWHEKTGKSVHTLYRHKRWLDGQAKG